MAYALYAFSGEEKFVSKYFLSTDAGGRCSSNLPSERYVSEQVFVLGSEAHFVELDY